MYLTIIGVDGTTALSANVARKWFLVEGYLRLEASAYFQTAKYICTVLQSDSLEDTRLAVPDSSWAPPLGQENTWVRGMIAAAAFDGDTMVLSAYKKNTFDQLTQQERNDALSKACRLGVYQRFQNYASLQKDIAHALYADKVIYRVARDIYEHSFEDVFDGFKWLLSNGADFSEEPQHRFLVALIGGRDVHTWGEMSSFQTFLIWAFRNACFFSFNTHWRTTVEDNRLPVITKRCLETFAQYQKSCELLSMVLKTDFDCRFQIHTTWFFEAVYQLESIIQDGKLKRQGIDQHFEQQILHLRDNSQFIQLVEVYDPQSKSWKKTPVDSRGKETKMVEALLEKILWRGFANMDPVTTESMLNDLAEAAGRLVRGQQNPGST